MAAPEPLPENRGRVPYRFSRLKDRWDCASSSIYRERQKPGFPAVFYIGHKPYVWLDELEDYEARQAQRSAAE